MTPEQASTAIIAAGCGWVASGKVVLTESAIPGYCNSIQCRTLATAAQHAGVTADELGAAVRSSVDGDDSALRAILSG